MPTFNLKDADKALYDMSQRHKKAALKGLVSAGQKLVQHIQTKVIPETYINTSEGKKLAPPVDEGAYRAGWRSRLVGEAVEIFHVDQKIAAIMENGVRPENVKISRAMIAALAKWAFRKGLGGSTVVKASAGSSDNIFGIEFDAPVTLRTAPKVAGEAIAWAIAKKMQKVGIEARRVLERAMEKAPEFVIEEVNREITRALNPAAYRGKKK